MTEVVRECCYMHLYTQSIRDISAGCFRRPHNAHNLTALHAIVARDRVIKLDPWQLRVLYLIPADSPSVSSARTASKTAGEHVPMSKDNKSRNSNTNPFC